MKPSQKPQPKPARDMTTEEAIRHLFPEKVIAHAKRHVAEGPKSKRKAVPPKSMSED